MGLTVDIYKGPYECSNGGLSSRVSKLTLMNVPGAAEPSEDRPAAMLIAGAHPGIAVVVEAEKVRSCIHCGRVTPDSASEPICSHAGLTGSHSYFDSYEPRRDPNMVGPMMGGQYVACSDYRLREAVEAITGHRFYGAIPLHDRYETQELYDSMFN